MKQHIIDRCMHEVELLERHYGAHGVVELMIQMLRRRQRYLLTQFKRDECSYDFWEHDIDRLRMAFPATKQIETDEGGYYVFPSDREQIESMVSDGVPHDFHL